MIERRVIARLGSFSPSSNFAINNSVAGAVREDVALLTSPILRLPGTAICCLGESAFPPYVRGWNREVFAGIVQVQVIELFRK